MAINYKDIGNNRKTTKSFLNQLIDVISGDISGSTSRRNYQVFVTGGVGPGVTSSLFQTVYDQDFTLQTSNPVFDITFGLAPPNVYTTGISSKASTANDVNGKYLYPSNSLMMREKTDIYGQFAQTLLGSRNNLFKLPQNASQSAAGDSTTIDAALFLAFKRLFARDQIKRETFAMRFFHSASIGTNSQNLYSGSKLAQAVFTDLGSADQRFFDVGGQYGYLVNSSNVTDAVGLIYYDSGIVVLDVSKAIDGTQFASGTIRAMTPTGRLELGGPGTATAGTAQFIPDLLVSGSIDNIIDHFCYSRFGDDADKTAITFQNVTNINSSLIFCRAGADDFNFSTNPTYVETSSTTSSPQGQLNIVDSSLPSDTQEPFTYITTIGLYDDNDGLLAVAKLSRPVEKNPGRDLTFRVRLDF